MCTGKTALNNSKSNFFPVTKRKGGKRIVTDALHLEKRKKMETLNEGFSLYSSTTERFANEEFFRFSLVSLRVCYI